MGAGKSVSKQRQRRPEECAWHSEADSEAPRRNSAALARPIESLQSVPEPLAGERAVGHSTSASSQDAPVKRRPRPSSAPMGPRPAAMGDRPATAPDASGGGRKKTRPGGGGTRQDAASRYDLSTSNRGNEEEGGPGALLLEDLVHKVSGIKQKAQEYRTQLQMQIVEIEQERTKSASELKRMENGVVTADYNPPDMQSSDLMSATQGDKVEIIMRDATGWAYCRLQGASNAGWLPSSRVAELAALMADHDGGEHSSLGSLLKASKGSTVEVMHRHYTGWAFCRQWTDAAGGARAAGTADLATGWITDAYLEDLRSEAVLASKWHRLVIQALEKLAITARKFEIALAKVRLEDLAEEFSLSRLSKSLEFTMMLAGELQSISEAIAQRQLCAAANGKGVQAIVRWDVEAQGPLEMSVEAGDQVLILDAEQDGEWAWCVSLAGDVREGWVPRNFLAWDSEQPTGVPQALGAQPPNTVQPNPVAPTSVAPAVATAEETGPGHAVQGGSPAPRGEAPIPVGERGEAKRYDTDSCALALCAAVLSGPSKKSGVAADTVEEQAGDANELGNASYVSEADYAMVNEARRLCDPDTWDSEGEGTTKRAGALPDIASLAGAWLQLDGALDAVAVVEAQHSKEQGATDHVEEAVKAIDTMEAGTHKDLQQRIDAYEAAGAQQHSNSIRQLLALQAQAAQAAEAARERYRASSAARLALRTKKEACEKEALRRALMPDPSTAPAATFLPDAAALAGLSAAGAVAEVAQATGRLFRSLEVLALRPPESLFQSGGRDFKGPDQTGTSQQAKKVESACKNCMLTLGMSLGALVSKLNRERREAPQPEPSLEAALAASDQADTGEKDSQWEAALAQRLSDHEGKQAAQRGKTLDRVDRVLSRRWRRKRAEEQPRSVERLAALTEAIQRADASLDAIRKTHLDRQEEETQQVTAERRRLHEQTQVLLKVAMPFGRERTAVQQVIATHPASTAEKEQKQQSLIASARRVWRLIRMIEDMDMVPELSQKRSAVLQSMHTLEAKLKEELGPLGIASAELLDATDNSLSDEVLLETTPEQRRQLEATCHTFEESLAKDVAAVKEKHKAAAKEEMAKTRRDLRRAIEVEHGDCLPAAQSAVDASTQRGILAEFSVQALQPFAEATTRLTVESLRHAELERSAPRDASTLRPRRGNLESALDASVAVLQELQQHLQQRGCPELSQVSRKGNKDWESTLAAAKQLWELFCESAPGEEAEKEKRGGSSPEKKQLPASLPPIGAGGGTGGRSGGIKASASKGADAAAPAKAAGGAKANSGQTKKKAEVPAGRKASPMLE